VVLIFPTCLFDETFLLYKMYKNTLYKNTIVFMTRFDDLLLIKNLRILLR